MLFIIIIIMRVRAYMMAVDTDTPSICNKGPIVLGYLLYRGHLILASFVLNGFLTGGL